MMTSVNVSPASVRGGRSGHSSRGRTLEVDWAATALTRPALHQRRERVGIGLVEDTLIGVERFGGGQPQACQRCAPQTAPATADQR